MDPDNPLHDHLPEIGPVQCFSKGDLTVFFEALRFSVDGILPYSYVMNKIEKLSNTGFWLQSESGRVLYVWDGLQFCIGGIPL